MTDLERAEDKLCAIVAKPGSSAVGTLGRRQACALLAELKRLRATNATMRDYIARQGLPLAVPREEKADA